MLVDVYRDDSHYIHNTNTTLAMIDYLPALARKFCDRFYDSYSI